MKLRTLSMILLYFPRRNVIILSIKYMKNNKNVYIIAGPNGLGKTTFANKFLPDYVMSEFCEC